MRVRVLSDLHVEFFGFNPPAVSADVIVLAGDILTEHYGLVWAREKFPSTPIVYVLGNHEFYGARYEDVLERCHKTAEESGIELLECNEVVIGGVRFLGTTLWTDFEVERSPSEPEGFAMWYARRSMTDFTLIRYRGGLLSPEATREFHLEARRWLAKRLAEPFAGRTVVVTHHLPHRRSIDRQFHLHPLNPAFASHMPELVRQPVDLWIHGHTHCSCDYEVDGTRVICNPRGYGPTDLNPSFKPALVVEI